MVVLDVHDGAARRSLTFDDREITVGRDAGCSLSLPGDPTVSRVHARLAEVPGGWMIEDAGSRNGTKVNGRPLVGSQRLQIDDRILVGEFLLVFRGAGGVNDTETLAADDWGRSRAQVETGLSARELDVLRLLCAGATDQQIAETLFISVKTVQSHLERIRDKTGHRRRPELIRFAMDHGLA